MQGTHCYTKRSDWDQEKEVVQNVQIEMGSLIHGEVFPDEDEGLSPPTMSGVLCPQRPGWVDPP
jgi:hypothetical protein